MVQPISTTPPPPPPPSPSPPIEGAEAAGGAVKLSGYKVNIVAVRRTIEKPLTNRGSVKEKMRRTMTLLPDTLREYIPNPQLDDDYVPYIEKQLIPGGLESANGFDRLVYSVVEKLIATVKMDQDVTGKTYKVNNDDSETPISKEAIKFWETNIPHLSNEDPDFEAAIPLVMRFLDTSDSVFGQGGEITNAVLLEIAKDYNLEFTDSFIVGIKNQFKGQEVPQHEFEGLKVLERIILKCIANNCFGHLDPEFHDVEVADLKNLMDKFKNLDPDSKINPLLSFYDLANVTVSEQAAQAEEEKSDEAAASGHDEQADVEGVEKGGKEIKFS